MLRRVLQFRSWHPFGLSFQLRTPPLAESFVLAFGQFVRPCFANTAFCRQDSAFIEYQEFVQFGLPVFEKNLLSPPCEVLGKVKPHGDDSVQFADLDLVQIVLCDRDIGLPDDLRFPGRQTHVRLAVVSAPGDEFGRPIPVALKQMSTFPMYTLCTAVAAFSHDG